MRKAVIIGASSGLGLEVAKILLNDGWHIGVAARRSALLNDLKRLCPDRVDVEVIDVTAEGAELQLRSLMQRMGSVQLFFYASGIGRQNHQLDSCIEMSTVTTNALGFARMVGEAYRYMAEHGGQIAVISSIAGTKGLDAAPSYSATKAFQNTYIQALEQQAAIRHLDIAFTDIRPGFVDTALLGDGSHYPLLMQPDAVARSIVRAIYARRHILVIDWRWRIVTVLWRLVPACVWRRLRVGIGSAG